MLNDTQNEWKSRHETPEDTRRRQNGRQHLAATGAAGALKTPCPTAALWMFPGWPRMFPGWPRPVDAPFQSGYNKTVYIYKDCRGAKRRDQRKRRGFTMFHILVVDDDKHTRMLLRAILENANYTVSTAENGEEALDVLDREHIDLVVLDVMMPKMNGYEFTKIIRNGNDALPILMVTAKALPADEKQGFLVGTDDYITKPIDGEKLLLRIKALLRRARIASEQRIVVGDVTLDYSTHTVSRKGEAQVLPQKEFMLLFKLLSYPGQIFTRIQLMDEIWGTDSETGWETVTVHVGRLRKRFEGWDEFEIVAVRGLGYQTPRSCRSGQSWRGQVLWPVRYRSKPRW